MPPASPYDDASREFAQEWLRHLPDLFRSHVLGEDADEHIRRAEQRGYTDKICGILYSDPFRQWLRTKSSQALLIQCENPPQNVNNSLSFVSAFTAVRLRKLYDFPVLYYSCGFLRQIDPSRVPNGGRVVVSALNAQLLKRVHEGTLSVDSLRVEQGHIRQTHDDLRWALALLEEMVDQIKSHAAVVIIIDSAAQLTGDQGSINMALERICRLADDENTTVKILITNSGENMPFMDHVHKGMLIKGTVDREGEGVNLSHLEQFTQMDFEAFGSKFH